MEAGAAIHLALEELEPIDMAFDDAVAVVRISAIMDGRIRLMVDGVSA
ncbi:MULTISPECIES: hypothetical protein [Burkholderiaceae]|nr:MULTISPECIES: hypothetical protein [Burkholderiaceae]MCG1040712.1 hypothetical protein [Mycetohabitans sp. B7]